MKLRWRLLVTLAVAGLLPLIPLLLSVSSLVNTSTRALTPEELGDALQSGLGLARMQYRDLIESQEKRLRGIISSGSNPSVNRDARAIRLDSLETIYCGNNGQWWKRDSDNTAWQPIANPPPVEEKDFQSLPTCIKTTQTDGEWTWVLELELDSAFRRSAETLRRASVDWTSRGIDRERLITSLLGTYLLIYILVVALSILAGQVVMSFATSRIERLTETARLVAEGDETVRTDVTERDEIGRLGNSFNLMLDRLEASRRQAATMEKMAAWRELARVLAHEIKNPLTPIQLSVQQLADSYGKSEDEKKFGEMLAVTREIVDEEVESLRNLTQEFSEFARAPKIMPVPANPAELVCDLAALYAPRLETMVKADDVIFDFDREKMKRALINLVDNALAAGGDEPQVILRLIASETEITFEVEDNGQGVPGHILEEIFEPYYTTKRTGIGLGLPVVRTVAEQHGGCVECTTGQSLGGALFRIRIERDDSRKTSLE